MSFGPRVFFILFGEIMSEKVFTSIDDQIHLLESRGFLFDKESSYAYAKNILLRIGYYNLVNGYGRLFIEKMQEDGSPLYKQGATIQELNALYEFDRKLRDIFLRHILSFETHIKSLVSYHFSEVHGHKNYLVYTNFDTHVKDSKRKITALLSSIQRLISDRWNDPSISHYLNEHGYIPLWVVNNILTFGVVSKFYSLMLQPERQAVAKHFGISDNNLQIIVQYISTVRNFCAHGDRIYCYRTKNPMFDTSFHEDLSIKKNDANEYLCGKRDLFAAVIALKMVLSKNDFKRLCKDIYRAIGYLKDRLSVLSLDEILAEMGFPKNWKNLKHLQKR